MKLNNRGWGLRMMIFLMTILVAFFGIAIYLIYNYYDDFVKNSRIEMHRVVSYGSIK